MPATMFLCDFKCFSWMSLLQVGTDKSFLPGSKEPPINKKTTTTNGGPRLNDDYVIFLSSCILLWFHLHALL
jgi:hypothetical protein